jgi:hypothetical protein
VPEQVSFLCHANQEGWIESWLLELGIFPVRLQDPPAFALDRGPEVHSFLRYRQEEEEERTQIYSPEEEKRKSDIGCDGLAASRVPE